MLGMFIPCGPSFLATCRLGYASVYDGPRSGIIDAWWRLLCMKPSNCRNSYRHVRRPRHHACLRQQCLYISYAYIVFFINTKYIYMYTIHVIIVLSVVVYTAEGLYLTTTLRFGQKKKKKRTETLNTNKNLVNNMVFVIRHRVVCRIRCTPSKGGYLFTC